MYLVVARLSFRITQDPICRYFGGLYVLISIHIALTRPLLCLIRYVRPTSGVIIIVCFFIVYGVSRVVPLVPRVPSHFARFWGARRWPGRNSGMNRVWTGLGAFARGLFACFARG